MCVTVKVICHPVTGKSKGYGFVKFSTEDEAAAALEKMSDEVIMCSLQVNFLQDSMLRPAQFLSFCLHGFST
jgi:RNA recognition motif-containing protein